MASLGTFSNAQVTLGIEDGIILTNASVFDFYGGNTVTGIGGNLGLPGNDNLNLLSNAPSFDQSSIQFSFIPSQTGLSFEYIFASEEYCDFVGTAFSDVLGIFLAGPGISGPYSVNGSPAINLAVFEDANGVINEVNIRTINHIENNNFYIDNNIASTSTASSCAGIDVSNNPFTLNSQFDGWTVPLTASYDGLQIGETYQIQIAVADVADAIFGSAIYLVGNSFNAGQSDINLIADAGSDLELQCDIATVSIGGDNTSMGALYSYEWLDESGQILSTDAVFDVSVAGEYTLQVTNSLTTEVASDTVVVSDNTDAPQVDVQVNDVLTCNNNTVTLSTDEDTSLEYDWSLQGATLGNQSTIEVDQAGFYELIVTDTNNGCTASFITEVSQDIEPPFVSIATPEILNCFNTFVILDGTGSDSGAEIIYNWSFAGITISNQAMVEVTSCGVYTLEVTNNNNGCINMEEVQVFCDENIPTAIIEVPDLLLPGGELQLSALGSSQGPNFQYQWNTTYGSIVSGTNTLTPTINQVGIYCLTVQDTENFCETTTCIEVQQDETSETIADAGPDQIITCISTEFILDGSSSSMGPEFTYSWTDPTGTEISTEITVTVTIPGTYTLTVTNTETGEQATDIVEFLEDLTQPFAEIEISSPGMITCEINELNLVLTTDVNPADAQYLWEGPGIASDPTLKDIVVNAPGTYTAIVTNMINGCFTTTSAEVTSNINNIAITTGLVTCDSTLLLDPTEFFTGELAGGEWRMQQGLRIDEFPLATATMSGSYSFVGVNAENFCEVEIIFLVSIPQETSVDAGADQEIMCPQDEIVLTASISPVDLYAEYVWRLEGIGPVGNTASITVSTPGVYTVEVFDLISGCSTIDEVVVGVVENLLTIDVEVTDVSCFGANDGSIIYNVSGGEQPYTFAGGFPTLKDLAPGIYNVTIMDALQCSYESTIEIAEPDALDLSFEVTAYGDLMAIASGGVSPYEYEWSTGSDSSILVNPEEGIIYTLTVTDSTDCTSSIEILLQSTAVNGLQTEELNVYPNPTDDYLIINQEGIASALKNIKLVDMHGREIQLNHIIQDRDNIKLDMQFLRPGIYFIHVIVDQKLFYQKVIVQ